MFIGLGTGGFTPANDSNGNAFIILLLYHFFHFCKLTASFFQSLQKNDTPPNSHSYKRWGFSIPVRIFKHWQPPLVMFMLRSSDYWEIPVNRKFRAMYIYKYRISSTISI